MKIVSIALCSALVLSVAAGGPDGTSPPAREHASAGLLKDCRDAYQAARERIEKTFADRQQELLETYAKTLDLSREQYRKGGDLKAVLATEAEKERFREERTVPKSYKPSTPSRIVQARTDYHKALYEADSRRIAALHRLLKGYRARLAKIKRTLTRETRIDEALGVREEIKKAVFDLAVLESKIGRPKPTTRPRGEEGEEKLAALPEGFPAGLVLWLPFDDDKTMAQDRSGKGNDGRVLGSAWTSDGCMGGACRVGSGMDRIEIPHSDHLSFGRGDRDGPFSVAAWIKADNFGGLRIINKAEARNREWHFGIHPASRNLCLVCTDRKASQEVNSRIIAESHSLGARRGRWVHVAGTYDGSGDESGLRTYVNGREDVLLTSDQNDYGTMGKSGGPLRIGVQVGWDGALKGSTPGLIDEVMVFNRELKQGDILYLYRMGQEVLPDTSR